MTLHKKNIGAKGENIACKLLKDKGYQIIGKNFRTRWGEIDIIAKNKNKLIFIEVKTRVGYEKGKPYEAINLRKLQHLKRAIEHYLLINEFKEYKLSLDVIGIVLDTQLEPVEIKHYENLIL